MTILIRHACALLGALLLANSLTACGEATSTSAFKGESHNVAQAISSFQSDATAGNDQRVCQNDLSSAVRAHLKRTGSDCRQAVKGQLSEIDTLELRIESIAVHGSTASARVKSTYSGKPHLSTLALVKEGTRWKISGVQ